MFKKSAPVLLLGMLLLAMPVTGMSQSAKGAEKGTTTVPVGGSKGPVTIESLITRYTPLAGSLENATSLVNGLRSGSEITLTLLIKGEGMCLVSVSNCPVTNPMFAKLCPMNPLGRHDEPRPCPDVKQEVKFTPPTGNMGLANVDIALAFTEAQLVELGLGTPTPVQLQAALMGDIEVEYGTNPKLKKMLPGILKLRAGGMGWGQIAGDLGYTLQ